MFIDAIMPGKLKAKIVAGRHLPVMDRASDLTDAFVEVGGDHRQWEQFATHSLFILMTRQVFAFGFLDDIEMMAI